MIWTAWVNEARDRYPVELTCESDKPPTTSKSFVDAKGVSGWKIAQLIVGKRFQANTRDEAVVQFNHWRKTGLPLDGNVVQESSEQKKIWRHKGAPHYLSKQASRMELPDNLVSKAKRNPEIKDLDRVMGEVSRRYHETRAAQAGSTVFPEPVKASVAMSLKHYEDTVSTLHMLAAASAVELDDAWRAFGIDPPTRLFQVVVGPPVVTSVAVAEIPKEPEPAQSPTVIEPPKPTNPNPGKHQHPKHQPNAGVN